MPMFPVPLPVLPLGVAAAFALTQIEAMMFKGFEEASKIAEKLMKQYYTDLDKAKQQRKDAEQELYQSEKDRQEEIKEEIKVLETDIKTLEEEIIVIKKTQDEEMGKYKAVVFEYKENAKKADAIGDYIERDKWIAKVEEHDEWLGTIILMTVEIIHRKIDIMNKERELEDKKYLAELKIENDWDWMEDKATDFEVIVPYHPDLPLPPNLPNSGVIPQESPLIKFGRQIFAKWIVAPMIPPIGLIVAAVMLQIQSMEPSTPPPAAAKSEASADSLILQLGGAI